MKRSLSQIRSDSRDALAGRYFLTFGGVMILFVSQILLNQIALMIPYPSSAAASAVFSLILNVIFALPLTMLEAGFVFMTLNIARYGRPSVNDMFLAFRYESSKAAVLSLIIGAVDTICVFPFTLALSDFIVDAVIGLPGAGNLSIAGSVGVLILSVLLFVLLRVVLAFPISQTIYLYIDHQDYSVSECLSKSRALMRGHKLEYLKLLLSLVGYFALSICSLGLGLVWTVPYAHVCRANFYMDLTGNYRPY